MREPVNRFRAAQPRVFNLLLHSTHRNNGDHDLLVDALLGATLLDLGGLPDDRKSPLSIDVELLTPDD